MKVSIIVPVGKGDMKRPLFSCVVPVKGERYVVKGELWRVRAWWRVRRIIGTLLDRLAS